MPSLLNELVQKFPSRISTSLLCALFVIEMYISRINLSIAIVSMVQTVTEEMIHSDTKREPFCLRNISDYSLQRNTTCYKLYKCRNLENTEAPPIQMTSTERGNILSSFFYLYGVSAILGGRLAELYGAKKVCGAVLLMDVLTNFLTPLVSQSSYWLFFTLRLTTGFFQGMGYPAINFHLSQWTPPSELSRTVTFVAYASNLGSILTMLFSGYVISLLGWEYVFYISGSFSLLCLTLWIFFLFDKPETHPRISLQEKRYIIDSLKERNLKKKPDSALWLKMLKSLPVWAINFGHAGSMCGLGFLVTQLPIYLSSIMGVNIRNDITSII
ncbi:putative transporter slc-17.2 [Armadillidium vulgare]|nr:putative transporter slc-17.2 [Armadillidium vulgare]